MCVCVCSFIHSFSRLPDDRSKLLPKPALHTVRTRASFFKWDYPLLSLRSSSSVLRLLPRLPVTFIPPFLFPSITRWRMQFIHKMWPIQFIFHYLFHAVYSSSPWLWVILLHFSHVRSNWYSPSFSNTTFQFQFCIYTQFYITLTYFSVTST